MSWLSRFKGPWGPLGSLRRMAFLEHLGLGGQGDVWLARDRLLSRLVTVKKVDTADAASHGTLRSLQARVDVAHPAIPTVFAVPVVAAQEATLGGRAGTSSAVGLGAV